MLGSLCWQDPYAGIPMLAGSLCWDPYVGRIRMLGSLCWQVRPYGFEGIWPDMYYAQVYDVERAVFFFQVWLGSSEMPPPVPVRALGVVVSGFW